MILGELLTSNVVNEYFEFHEQVFEQVYNPLYIKEQVLMFYHLKTRRCVSTAHMIILNTVNTLISILEVL